MLIVRDDIVVIAGAEKRFNRDVPTSLELRIII